MVLVNRRACRAVCAHAIVLVSLGWNGNAKPQSDPQNLSWIVLQPLPWFALKFADQPAGGSAQFDCDAIVGCADHDTRGGLTARVAVAAAGSLWQSVMAMESGKAPRVNWYNAQPEPSSCF